MIELKPDFTDAHLGLATALREAGSLNEAIASYRRALTIDPQHAEAHTSLGVALLAAGEFAEGWQEYEWRWKTKEFTERMLSQPLWDGLAIEGRTILVHAEQGLGDTIQFVRYLSLLKQRGARVIFECQRPLVRLLQSCSGIDNLVAKGDPLPEFDVHVPLMSLPRLFHTTVETIPAGGAYLAADSKRAELWRQRLARYQGLKVGICWQGSTTYPRDRNRSVPLRHFSTVASTPDIVLVSLQKGDGVDQLADLRVPLSVIDFGDTLDQQSGPFVDTAALMAVLDLIISVDTSIAHLAGALGVPVWLALDFAPEWRWLRNRDDSPWYPRMRLFRQRRPGEWDDVFQRIAAAIDDLRGQRQAKAQRI